MAPYAGSVHLSNALLIFISFRMEAKREVDSMRLLYTAGSLYTAILGQILQTNSLFPFRKDDFTFHLKDFLELAGFARSRQKIFLKTENRCSAESMNKLC